MDWDFVAVSGFLFFVVGVLATRPVRQEEASPGWALGAAAVVCVAVASLVLPWLSVRKTDDANAAIGRLDFANAAADARSAHSLNPLALGPLYALGLAETLRGRLAEAQRAYARAVRDQPDNPEPWFNPRRLRAAGGRPEDCLRLPRAGHRARPVRQDGRRRANRGLRA